MPRDCREALDLLAAGMDDTACHDFRAIRQVAMCDAWHRMEARGVVTAQSFGDALRDSWATIHTRCEPHGGAVPESGFLRPAGQRAPTGPYNAIAPQVAHVYELRVDGRPAGVIVQEVDGTMTSCVGGDCRTLAGGDPDQRAFVSALNLMSGGRLEARPL